MVDNYQNDFTTAQTLYDEMATNYEEKCKLEKTGTSTGRVDYRLKGGIESLK